MAHCPQDGGFIGDGGCTHPNHVPSATVKKILDGANEPVKVTPTVCDAALREGFTVENPSGQKVKFGERLLTHLNHHEELDARGRKAKLMFAVNAVQTTTPRPNPKGGPNSLAYAKAFGNRGVLVLTDRNGRVDDVFDIIPKRTRELRK